MLNPSFVQSILGLVGRPRPSSAASEPSARQLFVLFTSPVAEFQYHNGEAVWGELRVGQPLTLVREPRNPYDDSAVRVEWKGCTLGYVPRTENHAIARRLDRSEKLSARIVELKSKNDSWEWEWERVRFEVLLEKIVSPAGRHTGNGKHTL